MPMHDPLIAKLSAQIERLIAEHQALKAEHQQLQQAAHTWREERQLLIDKNTLACNRIEAMIARLKKWDGPMSKQHRVNLSLLEKEYQIACPPEEQAALITAAKEVERRMRTTRLQQGVVGAERIAVVVALNLCYELQQLQAQMVSSSPVDARALEMLLAKVEAALKPADTSADL